MSQNVEELTFEYRNEEGELLRRELDKVVLSKGAWATVMYLYQDLDRASGTYKPPKVAIVRYRKSRGVYRKQTSFNISSERQGRMIMEVLERWYATADQMGAHAEGPGQAATSEARTEAAAEPSRALAADPQSDGSDESPQATPVEARDGQADQPVGQQAAPADGHPPTQPEASWPGQGTPGAASRTEQTADPETPTP